MSDTHEVRIYAPDLGLVTVGPAVRTQPFDPDVDGATCAKYLGKPVLRRITIKEAREERWLRT